jgi:chemotaxis protein histidine kinase CheA
MTRFHFTFDSPSDDDAYPEKELVYSDDDDEDENDAPENSRGNVNRTSRYALECCDIELVDCSLVAYTQYPPLIPEEARSPIVLPGRNAETASIPALCQLSFGSPRYDTPLRSSSSSAIMLRNDEDDIPPSYDQDMLRMAQWVREIPPMATPRRSAPRAWRPATDDDDDTSRQALRQLREQLQQQHAEAQQALQKLLQQEADQAALIQKAEQEVLRRQKEEQEVIEREAAEKEEAEREATLQREQDRLKAQEQEAARAQESAAAASTSPPRSRRSSTEGKSPARKTSTSHERIDDHAARAFKLRAQLVDVQQSVAEFETSPRVKDRRLSYKKLVNGRINTLAENVPKIRHVAQEVEQAIATARQADEANKTPSSSKSDITILGKRYLVNLLASKVMVRAQAEGFNGYVFFLYYASLHMTLL